MTDTSIDEFSHENGVVAVFVISIIDYLWIIRDVQEKEDWEEGRHCERPRWNSRRKSSELA